MIRPAASVALALCLAAGIQARAADDGFPKCAARYAKIGLPRMKSDGSEDGPIALCRQGYAAAFNPKTRTPDWVIERLPEAWLTGKATRSNKFEEDKSIGEGLSAINKDYSGQGFDRGHQAPAGDFKSSQPMTNESFLFTNMSPQVGIGFNRNIWKQLETDVRGWILCGGRPELYVVTGPVFDDTAPERWIPSGKNERVRVPDAFFKVIYDPANNRALGMLLPNKKLDTADLPQYAVPISEIEEKTGITFFPALAKRQQNILKKSTSALWGADDSCTKDAGE
ncbi:MAG: DNA/RNA non-specific endonuclease [Rhizomicrobium sp.]